MKTIKGINRRITDMGELLRKNFFFFSFFFFFFFFFFILVVKKKASNEFCLLGEWECGNLSFCVKGRERMVFSLDVTRNRIGSLR